MSETNKKDEEATAPTLNKDLLCDDVDDSDEIYDRSLYKEAQRIIEEIRFGVDEAAVSEILEHTDAIAYMNMRTLEKDEYCVELSGSGYMIVAHSFDKIDEKVRDENLSSMKRYETCEALMHQISPAFVKKFNMSVAERLNLIS